jgi:hypothetical protein
MRGTAGGWNSFSKTETESGVMESTLTFPMNATLLVRRLLEDDQSRLAEATVRLPPRGSRWIAVYTGDAPGEQVARSTGLTDREAALDLARQWETEARERRAQNQHRVGAGALRAGHAGPGALTQAQVAAILNLSPRSVRAIEKRAVRKLRRHPLVRQMWKEFGEAAPGRAAG